MSDPNLTSFQGRMCTRVKRQVDNTLSPGNSTSTSISTSTTSTSTSTATATATATSTSTSTSISTTTDVTSTSPQVQSDQKTTTTTQQPQVVNTNTPTTKLTTTTTNNAGVPNRPPQDQTTDTVAASPSTATTTTQAGTQDPLPAVQRSTTANTRTTAAPAQSPNSTQNQPAQVPAATPNTQNTVQTAPAGGGQQPAQTDTGKPPSSPQAGNMNTQTAGTTATAVAGTIGAGATPQAGGAQPALAQPVPILLSTGQTTGTALPTGEEPGASPHEPSTSTTIFLSTGTDGQPTSITSAIVVTPTAAHDGDGHGHGAGHSADGHPESSKDVAPGVVVGGVFGAIAFLAIAALIFFCIRRRRRGSNRGSGTPLIASRDGASSVYSGVSAKFAAVLARRPRGDTFSNAKLAMSEKVGAVFAKRPSGETFSRTKAAMSEKFGAVFAKGEKESSVPRIPTPNLEHGMRDASSSVYTKSTRTRSSSVPVMALKDRALGFLKASRSGSRPRFGHKRDSDTSFVGVAITSDAPPRLPSPAAQHRRSTSSVPSFIQSWSATDENNNPFRDPDPSQPLRVKNPDLSRPNTIVTELPPILKPKSFAPMPSTPITSNGASARSPGVIAAAATVVPALNQPPKPRHKRSFSQTRIQNPFLDPEPSAASASPTSQYTTADEILRPDSQRYRRHSRNHTVSIGRPLQHQPSQSSVDSGFVSAKSPLVERKEDEDVSRPDSDPFNQWNLSTVLSSRNSGNSMPSLRSSKDSPFSDKKRISQLSFLNDRGELSSSPGPTRPVTSAYPSYLLDRQSRVSDPFDLDRPEILALMKPHWTQTMASRDTSLTRSGSNRSSKSRRSRAAPTTPMPRKSSNAADYLPNSDVYRPL